MTTTTPASPTAAALLALALLASPPAPAAPRAEPVGGEREVTLADVVAMAMAANTEIKVRAGDVLVSEEDIEKARSRFDPNIVLYANVTEGKRPSPFDAHRPREPLTTAEAHATLSKRTQLGTTVDVGAWYGLSQADDAGALLNPLHTGSAGITLNQPLLRGAGLFVNRAPVELARRANAITDARFHELVMLTLTQVEAAYWELVLRHANLVDGQTVYAHATKLEDEARQRYEAGDFAEIDYLEAQRAAADRRAKLLEIRNALIRSEAKLKAITNAPEPLSPEVARWVPKDRPRFQAVYFSPADEIVTGLEQRPAFQAAKLDLEKQDISVRVAKNALLPQLDLIAGLTVEGIAGDARPRFDDQGNQLVSPYVGDAGDLFDHMSSGDGTRWNVGVELKFPLGRRYDKAHHAQRQAVARQAFERLVRAERTVIREVRTAIRIIGSDGERVRAAIRSRGLAEQLVEKSYEKVKLGEGSTREFVEALDDLADAHALENLALTEFVVSLTELERATGTLLANRGISLAPAYVATER